MCGITGFIDSSFRGTESDLRQQAAKMADSLMHRGPDHGAVWADRSHGLALAHRRLSILDLTPEGNQPMASRCGRFTMVFNGEIYNFPELRLSLEKIGWRFRGRSDTEILLAGFEEWGFEETLVKCVGMFAIASWDKRDGILQLARDRIGEKPLYYGSVGSVFLFGSELKALKQHPAWQGKIDRQALTLYMRHNYVPCPFTIFEGIFKLPPGTILNLKSSSIANRPEPKAYWSAIEKAEEGLRHPFQGSDSEAVHELEAVLKTAIQGQMVADVPLGAFLSGGIDSSTVVALMQAQSSIPVKTFTIGFQEHGYNEANQAKAVARHLGTDHTELYVTPEETRAVIPRIPEIYDEPFADSSQIPTFLVAQLAKRHVTVSLSGDAGDELFGGYNRYFWGRSLWGNMKWLPTSIRSAIGKGLGKISPAKMERLFSAINPVLPVAFQQHLAGDKISKLSEILSVQTPEEMYRKLVSHWQTPERVVIGGTEPPTALSLLAGHPKNGDFTDRMMFLDLITYLPDDILTKVDRACMAVSLESRVPMLDHRVVEFSWKLPMEMKIRGNQGKWLLRQVLNKYVPRELVERPKMGFGVPIDSWLRGPLRDWAEGLLDKGRLRREGYFDPDAIRGKWNEHLADRRNWQYHLWDVLMFQAWLEKNRE